MRWATRGLIALACCCSAKRRNIPRQLVSPCLFFLQVFRPRTPPEAIALCSRLLEYTPTARLTPLEACAHSFFDELRDPNVKLPNGREKPALFNFTTQGSLQALRISALGSAGISICCDARITLSKVKKQKVYLHLQFSVCSLAGCMCVEYCTR